MDRGDPVLRKAPTGIGQHVPQQPEDNSTHESARRHGDVTTRSRVFARSAGAAAFGGNDDQTTEPWLGMKNSNLAKTPYFPTISILNKETPSYRVRGIFDRYPG